MTSSPMSAIDRDSVWARTASPVPATLPRRVLPSKSRKIWNCQSRELLTRLSGRVAATRSSFRLPVSQRRRHPVTPTRIAANIPAACPRSLHTSDDNSTRHAYLGAVASGQTLGTRHALSIAETLDAYPADSRRACDVAPSL